MKGLFYGVERQKFSRGASNRHASGNKPGIFNITDFAQSWDTTVDPSVPLGGSEPVWNQTADANNEWSDQEQG